MPAPAWHGLLGGRRADGSGGRFGGTGRRRAGRINEKSEEFRKPTHSSDETSSFTSAAADADFTARGRRCGRSSRKESRVIIPCLPSDIELMRLTCQTKASWRKRGELNLNSTATSTLPAQSLVCPTGSILKGIAHHWRLQLSPRRHRRHDATTPMPSLQANQ